MVGQRFQIVGPAPLQFSFQNVRTQSEVIWRDVYCGKVLRLAILFWVFTVGLLAWKFRHLPPQVPIYYSRPWGEAQLSTPLGLWFLPGFSLGVLVVTLVAGGSVFSTDKLLAKIMMTAVALTTFLTMFALVRIFWLVAS